MKRTTGNIIASLLKPFIQESDWYKESLLYVRDHLHAEYTKMRPPGTYQNTVTGSKVVITEDGITETSSDGKVELVIGRLDEGF